MSEQTEVQAPPVKPKRAKQKNSGRKSRGLVLWTFWFPEAHRDHVRGLAAGLTEWSGRARLESAVTRALVAEALTDPALIERALYAVTDNERLKPLTPDAPPPPVKVAQ